MCRAPGRVCGVGPGMRLLPALALLLLSGCMTAPQPPASPSDSAAPPPVSTRDGAMEIFGALDAKAGPQGNAFYSPFSLEQAFGLVHAGAAGETQRQIEDFFGWQRGAAGDAALGAEGAALRAQQTPADIRLANALWLNDAYAFAPAYLSTTATNYAATAEALDFQGDPQGSANRINAWASENTDGLIPQVVSKDEVADQTAAFLTNALYFEAEWEQALDDGMEETPFLFGDGREEDFRLMKKLGSFQRAERGEWAAIRLPYRGKRFVMDVIMPSRRRVIDSAPDPDTLARLSQALAESELQFTNLLLPRFEIDFAGDLRQPMIDLGLNLPFDPSNADLSPMVGDQGPQLYVGVVKQLTRLQVYAEGTKAAAVTVVQVRVVSGQIVRGRAQPFIVDRPFVSVIRDLETDAVLFIGRIAEPKPFEPAVDDPDNLPGN